jgi:hypothetical protein
MAQLTAIDQAADNHYTASLKQLMVNRNYILLLITYGT